MYLLLRSLERKCCLQLLWSIPVLYLNFHLGVSRNHLNGATLLDVHSFSTLYSIKVSKWFRNDKLQLQQSLLNEFLDKTSLCLLSFSDVHHWLINFKSFYPGLKWFFVVVKSWPYFFLCEMYFICTYWHRLCLPHMPIIFFISFLGNWSSNPLQNLFGRIKFTYYKL